MRSQTILLVEGSEDDALLVLRELGKGGFDLQSERVQDSDAFRQALRRQEWGLVIADYCLPGFNGLAALALLRETDLDVPFIIVSGAVGEEVAVQGMKAGAHDYLLKGNLSFEVMAWNPAAEVIFGFSAREALGRHASFIVPQSVRGQVDEVFHHPGHRFRRGVDAEVSPAVGHPRRHPQTHRAQHPRHRPPPHPPPAQRMISRRTLTTYSIWKLFRRF